MQHYMGRMKRDTVRVAGSLAYTLGSVFNMACLAPPPRRLFTGGCNLFPVGRVEMFPLVHHDAVTTLNSCRFARLARRASRWVLYHASCPTQSVDDQSSG